MRDFLLSIVFGFLLMFWFVAATDLVASRRCHMVGNEKTWSCQ